MARFTLRDAFREAQAAPYSVAEVVTRLGATIGATDGVAYLVDFGQSTLEPISDFAPHLKVPQAESVATSMAGRAFTDRACVVAERTGGPRVWVPIIEGSDCTGVLALTVPEANDAIMTACEELGLLAGYFIATHSRTTDLYNLYRRRKALSLAASLQWDLLPPLVLKAGNVNVAGMLEPAYDVGGDCFDYALNGRILNIAMVDAVGHGATSALISAITIGSYRHDRREGRSLEHTHVKIDTAISAHCAPFAFATGQLAQLDIETGTLEWTNAGHPLPLLIRQGRVISELEAPPTPPWGLGSTLSRDMTPSVVTESLEPGDGVLFYTDGVVEARGPDGEFFTVERLKDLTARHAADELEPEQIVRHIVGSVSEHTQDSLRDDATIVLLRWTGPTQTPEG